MITVPVLKLALQKFVLAAVAVLFYWLFVMQATPAEPQEPAGQCHAATRSSSTPLKGEVGESMVGTVTPPAFKLQPVAGHPFTLGAEQCRLLGFACSFSPGGKLPAKISAVKEGTPAFLGGLKHSDKVLFAFVTGNTTCLVIERAGKRFQVDLRRNWLAGIAPAAKIQGHATRLEQQLAILSTYDVAVVIDKSGSMKTPDCHGLTRWQWCEEQTATLSRQTASCFKNGMTVLTFNGDFKVFPGVSVDTVRDIFATEQPDDGTATELPVKYLIDDYFNRKAAGSGHVRPLVIAVITDGEPNQPERLRDVLVQATQQMTDPNELAVTFLQVGDGATGTAILQDLDDNLVNEGARYDIVDMKSFEELQRIGLIGGLVQAITELRTPGRAVQKKDATPYNYKQTSGVPSNFTVEPYAAAGADSWQRLRNVEKERTTLEKQLLQN